MLPSPPIFIETRPTEEKGDGIFAVKKIKQGEFITFYPVDAAAYSKDVIDDQVDWMAYEGFDGHKRLNVILTKLQKSCIHMGRLYEKISIATWTFHQ